MPLSYAQIEQRRAAGRARAAKLTSADQSRFGRAAVAANEVLYGRDQRGKLVWHVMGGKASFEAQQGAERFYPAGVDAASSYRRQLKRNGGSHTHEEWEALKARNGHKCVACGKAEPKIRLTKDHVIPVCRGGRDDIQNIQALCEFCNRSKNARLVWVPKQRNIQAEEKELNQLRFEQLLAGD